MTHPPMETCQLCQRQCPKLTVHHLIPRQHTKRQKKRNRQDLGPIIDICPACHKQIHALFSNKALATELNCVHSLQSHPEMQKFLKWIAKQDPYKRVRTYR